MKIKFKTYPWLAIDRQWPKMWGISLFPSIQLDCWRYKEGGWWFLIQISFLIFGITFDWEKEEKQDDQSN